MINISEIDFSMLYPWISKELFENILLENDSDIIFVESFTLTRAICKGENYTSQLIRANVKYSINNSEEKQISLIIKAPLKCAADITKVSDEFGLFKKEIAAYKYVLPEIERTLRSIGDYTKMSARFVLTYFYINH